MKATTSHQEPAVLLAAGTHIDPAALAHRVPQDMKVRVEIEADRIRVRACEAGKKDEEG